MNVLIYLKLALLLTVIIVTEITEVAKIKVSLKKWEE